MKIAQLRAETSREIKCLSTVLGERERERDKSKKCITHTYIMSTIINAIKSKPAVLLCTLVLTYDQKQIG